MKNPRENFDCMHYHKCPVCYKCMNADPSSYQECRECIDGKDRCKHNDYKRSLVIKRENFDLSLTEGTLNKFRELLEEE